MNARLLIALAVCFLFAVPAFADPIQYTITWTLTDGTTAPNTAQYGYGPVTSEFSAMEIGIRDYWDVFVVEFNRFNDGSLADRQEYQRQLLDQADNFWAITSDGGLPIMFRLNFGSYGGSYGVGFGQPEWPQPIWGQGTFTVTGPAIPAVPESGTLTLLSIALAFGLVTKRKWNRELSREL
jgi:hypothetical protein